MHRIAFGEFSPEDWGRFDLGDVELIDPKDQEGTGWEIVVVVKRAQIMVVVIFGNGCCVFGLVSAVDASAVDGLDEKPLEANGNHDQLTRNDFIFALVVGILLHLAMNYSHFALMLQ